MAHQTDSFIARGGITMFTQTWTPPGDPKALVVLVHGFAEHSGRYVHVAEAFVDAGYAVAACDLRGHGRSGGHRALMRDLALMAADIRLFREELERGPLGGLPTILLGHSLGGALALEHLVSDHEPLKAVVLSGPFLRNAVQVSPILKALAPVLARVLPTMPTEALDPALVSRDPEVVRAYTEDPLVFHGKIPAATGGVLLSLESRLMPQAPRVTEPVLIVHGTDDHLADVNGSRQLAGKLGGTVELKTYEGLYHEVFNEPERKDVLTDVIEWMDAQLG